MKTVPLKEAQYGITDRFHKDLLINLGMYYYSLEECNTVIRKYNETIPKEK